METSVANLSRGCATMAEKSPELGPEKGYQVSRHVESGETYHHRTGGHGEMPFLSGDLGYFMGGHQNGFSQLEGHSLLTPASEIWSQLLGLDKTIGSYFKYTNSAFISGTTSLKLVRTQTFVFLTKLIQILTYFAQIRE